MRSDDELELLREATEVPDAAVAALRRRVQGEVAARERMRRRVGWCAIPSLAAVAALWLLMTARPPAALNVAPPAAAPTPLVAAGVPVATAIPAGDRPQAAAKQRKRTKWPPQPRLEQQPQPPSFSVMRLETADPDVVIYLAGSATSGGE